MKSVYDLSKNELGDYLQKLGEPNFRAGQIFSALHNGVEITNIPNIPKTLREQIAKDFYCKLPLIEKELQSKDGTRKFLLKLHDNALIECVLLTAEYGKTACISSQVGCKMGCAFCASGACGFIRHLSAGEMLSQVLLLNSIEKLSNIVIMGSGEPFDNFDNTVKFLELVTCAQGVNIGARSISVSTSGLSDQIRRFADLGMQVNLCISLHAPNDAVRQKIMPIAKVHSIKDLIESAKYFFQKTKRRVIFEYALIDGVNSSPDQAVELARLLRGFPLHVNLINLNVTENSPLRPVPHENAKKFMDTLIKNGVSCTMRKSRGDDIAGACGQLVARE